MKKENKKHAQLQRAEQRRKEEKTHKIKKVCLMTIPIALILILVVALSLPSKEDASDLTTDASITTDIATDSSVTEDITTNTTADAAAPTLNTDTSLVVADGDTVNIDYVGTIDGVEFPGGSTGGIGIELIIGSKMYIDDFEEQLIGHHVGETVDVVVTFPEDYGMEELNGQEAVFTTVINGIYEYE